MSYDDELAQDKKDLRILTEIGRRNGVAAGSAVQGETPVNNARPAELSAEREARYRFLLQNNQFTWPEYNEAIAALLDELARVRRGDAEFQSGQKVLCANHAQTWYTARNTLQPKSGCVFCDMEALLADLHRKLGELADGWDEDFRENKGGPADCASRGCAAQVRALLSKDNSDGK